MGISNGMPTAVAATEIIAPARKQNIRALTILYTKSRLGPVIFRRCQYRFSRVLVAMGAHRKAHDSTASKLPTSRPSSRSPVATPCATKSGTDHEFGARDMLARIQPDEPARPPQAVLGDRLPVELVDRIEAGRPERFFGKNPSWNMLQRKIQRNGAGESREDGYGKTEDTAAHTRNPASGLSPKYDMPKIRNIEIQHRAADFVTAFLTYFLLDITTPYAGSRKRLRVQWFYSNKPTSTQAGSCSCTWPIPQKP